MWGQNGSERGAKFGPFLNGPNWPHFIGAVLGSKFWPHFWGQNGPFLFTVWSVLQQSISYTGGSKICNLCLEEKLCILKDKNKQNLLNKKSEIVSTCDHRKKHLINNLRNGRNACIV